MENKIENKILKLQTFGYQILGANSWAVLFRDEQGCQIYCAPKKSFIQLDEDANCILNEYFLAYATPKRYITRAYNRYTLLTSKGRDLTSKYKADMKVTLVDGCKLAVIEAHREHYRDTLILANSSGKTAQLGLSFGEHVSNIVANIDNTFTITIYSITSKLALGELQIKVGADLEILSDSRDCMSKF